MYQVKVWVGGGITPSNNYGLNDRNCFRTLLRLIFRIVWDALLATALAYMQRSIFPEEEHSWNSGQGEGYTLMIGIRKKSFGEWVRAIVTEALRHTSDFI